MSVTLRRRIAKVSLAVDVLLLIASLVGAGLGYSRGLVVTAVLAVVSIAAGLFYLHRSKGARP